MQMGSCFQDLINQAPAAANTCAFCGAKHGSTPQSSSPSGKTAIVGQWALMIAIIVAIALVVVLVLIPVFR